MERHPKQLHVRMSDREMESAKSLARELGMTVSDLVRVLLQLPAEEARGGARLVVVDRTTAARLSREMTRWGHHYNQAVHALNAIAYYLRANDIETSEVVEELSRAERKLAEMQPGVFLIALLFRKSQHKSFGFHGGCFAAWAMAPTIP